METVKFQFLGRDGEMPHDFTSVLAEWEFEIDETSQRIIVPEKFSFVLPALPSGFNRWVMRCISSYYDDNRFPGETFRAWAVGENINTSFLGYSYYDIFHQSFGWRRHPIGEWGLSYAVWQTYLAMPKNVSYNILWGLLGDPVIGDYDGNPDCGNYRVRLVLDCPVVDAERPEDGEKEYLLSGPMIQGQDNLVHFRGLITRPVWSYKIRRIDLVLTEGPFWGSVDWMAVDKNGSEPLGGSAIPNIGSTFQVDSEAPYSKGIPIFNGGNNPPSVCIDLNANEIWLSLRVALECGEPIAPGTSEPWPPEPPEEPVAPEEEKWPTGFGPEDDTLIIVEPPGEVTPPTIVTPPTTGTGPEGCECFEYLAGEIAIQAGYLGEILESVRQEVFISRRENNELLLRIETAILQEAAKNRNNLILRGLELVERLLAMNVDLGPLIAELSDGKSQSATNADTMKQAIEGLATAIEEASCCEPICERLDKIAKGVYFDEVVGEENRSLAMNTNLLLAGLNIWK